MGDRWPGAEWTEKTARAERPKWEKRAQRVKLTLE